jgi:ATP-dependent RNA helicase DeaD
MENVEVDEEQIAPFMDAVNKKLEWLSKEDIIKHFLSLEFNRFLEYYRNSSDLNDNTRPEASTRRKNNSESGGKSSRKRKKQNFTRLFVNAGKKDGLIPKNVIGMINDNTGDRDINVGDIDIKDSFSFFEVGERHTNKVMSSLSNVRFKGRKLQIQFAMEDQKSMKKKAKKKKKRSRVYQGE